MEDRINKLDVIQETLKALESENFLSYMQVKKELIEDGDTYTFRAAPYEKMTDIDELNDFVKTLQENIGLETNMKPFSIGAYGSPEDTTKMTLGRFLYHNDYGETTTTKEDTYFFDNEKNTKDTKEHKTFTHTIFLFLYDDPKRMQELPSEVYEETVIDITK
ncbi:MAG: hypothetical protein GQ477_02725 [Nanohaloarchaea archaeon]|nr:hypothetical protein [Candidatus Nanohaloarchaea archaeon]